MAYIRKPNTETLDSEIKTRIPKSTGIAYEFLTGEGEMECPDCRKKNKFRTEYTPAYIGPKKIWNGRIRFVQTVNTQS